MKADITNERIAKLPAWVREHIEELARQRNEAVETLRGFCDSQTVSLVSYSEYVFDGEEKEGGPSKRTNYLQTRYVDFDMGNGERFHIRLEDDGSLYVNSSMDDIVVVPRAGNAVYIRKGK